MSFDTLAPHYRWLETVLAGSKLQRCRITHLNQLAIGSVRNVLLAGEGPGRFLEIALQHFPGAQFTVVDGNERMLTQARQIAARATTAIQSQATGGDTASLPSIPHSAPNGCVSLESVDLREWTPPASTFDLIGTFFTLDCFRPDQLAQMIPRFAAALRPGGHWLISDFAIPPRGWRRRRAQLIHALMYGCFRRVTKLPAKRWTDPDDLLLKSGLKLVARDETDWGLLRADCWQRT